MTVKRLLNVPFETRRLGNSLGRHTARRGSPRPRVLRGTHSKEGMENISNPPSRSCLSPTFPTNTLSLLIGVSIGASEGKACSHLIMRRGHARAHLLRALPSLKKGERGMQPTHLCARPCPYRTGRANLLCIAFGRQHDGGSHKNMRPAMRNDTRINKKGSKEGRRRPPTQP